MATARRDGDPSTWPYRAGRKHRPGGHGEFAPASGIRGSRIPDGLFEDTGAVLETGGARRAGPLGRCQKFRRRSRRALAAAPRGRSGVTVASLRGLKSRPVVRLITVL